MSLFKSFTKKISGFFQNLGNEFLDFANYFLPKAGRLAEAALEDLVEIAGRAVLEQAPKVISGSVKFDNAVNLVVKEISTQGRTVAINTARAAVQLAYLEAQKIALGK